RVEQELVREMETLSRLQEYLGLVFQGEDGAPAHAKGRSAAFANLREHAGDRSPHPWFRPGRNHPHALHARKEAVEVVLQEGIDSLSQLLAEGGVESLREAKVDKENPRTAAGFGLLEHEKVSWMGVGVEEPIHEHLLGVGAGQHSEDVAGRNSKPCQRCAVEDRYCGLVAHGENVSCGVAWHDLGHHDLRLVSEIGCDLGGDLRFALEVELFGETSGELLEDAPLIHAPAAAQE